MNNVPKSLLIEREKKNAQRQIEREKGSSDIQFSNYEVNFYEFNHSSQFWWDLFENVNGRTGGNSISILFNKLLTAKTYKRPKRSRSCQQP